MSPVPQAQSSAGHARAALRGSAPQLLLRPQEVAQPRSPAERWQGSLLLIVTSWDLLRATCTGRLRTSISHDTVARTGLLQPSLPLPDSVPDPHHPPRREELPQPHAPGGTDLGRGCCGFGISEGLQLHSTLSLSADLLTALSTAGLARPICTVFWGRVALAGDIPTLAPSV